MRLPLILWLSVFWLVGFLPCSLAQSPKVGSPRAATIQRRVPRSSTARRAFMRQTGYPRGRPGYVVDHIVPLACGGADAPSNMQWQTIADAKAKDRRERRPCPQPVMGIAGVGC